MLHCYAGEFVHGHRARGLRRWRDQLKDARKNRALPAKLGERVEGLGILRGKRKGRNDCVSVCYRGFW